MKTKISIRHILCAASITLLSACGGGSDSGSSSASTSAPAVTYVGFAGNTNGAGAPNGQSVVDANNNAVKFRTDTRGMVLAFDQATNITLDSSNNIIKGTLAIGTVKLVQGSSGGAIAGLVNSDGTMLAVDTSTNPPTLKSTTTKFAAPGSGTGSGASSGSGSGSGSASGGSSSGTASASAQAACNAVPYRGEMDPQVYVYDAIAQLDICLYKASNDSYYVKDGEGMCKVLTGLIKELGSRFRPLYCTPTLAL